MPVIIYPQNSWESRAPPDPLRPCDRAKSYPHSSLRDPRRKNGRCSQIQRATTFLCCPPGYGNQLLHFILGSAVERSILDKHSVSSNPPVHACFFFFLLLLRFFFSCTRVQIHLSASQFDIFLLSCCTNEYCCCTVVHTWWVRGCWWWKSFSAVYCALLL